MSTLTVKELSAPTGEVIKIAAGKTLDLNSQGTLILPTIPASKLPTIPASKMPSGSIVQVATVMPNVGNVTLSSASWTEASSTLRIAFTPKFANSKLIIECSFMFGGNHTSNITHFKLYDITNSADIELSTAGNRQGVHGSARQVDTDSNDCDNMNLQVVTGASNTNARTYGMFAKNEGGSSAKYYFANESNNTQLAYAKPILKITEVAG